MKGMYDVKKCTRKGRVVYDRARHAFRRSDVLRVARGAGVQRFVASVDGINAILTRIRNDPVNFSFGGGSFGGGGATRDYGEPEKRFFIIEER